MCLLRAHSAKPATKIRQADSSVARGPWASASRPYSGMTAVDAMS